MKNVFAATIFGVGTVALAATAAAQDGASPFVEKAMAANKVVESAPNYGPTSSSIAVTNNGDVLYLETSARSDGATFSHILWLAERSKDYGRREFLALSPSSNRLYGKPFYLKPAPDRQLIAMLEPGDQGDRLMIRDLTTGDAKAAPGLEDWGSVQQFEWAGEGRLVVLVNEKPPATRALSRIVSDRWYLNDDRDTLPPSALLSVDLSTGKTSRYKIQRLAIVAFALSPDRNHIALQGARSDDQTPFPSDVFLFDVATEALTEIAAFRNSDRSPAFTRDGSKIVLRTQWGKGDTNLTFSEAAVYDIASGKLSPANDPMLGVSVAQFLNQEEFVGARYWDMRVKLVRGNVAGSLTFLRDDEFETERGVTVSPNGHYVAFIAEAFDAPPRIHVKDLRNGSVRVISPPIPDEESAAAFNQAVVTRLEWKSPNGYVASGYLIEPPKNRLRSDKPLYVWIKGGPDMVYPEFNENMANSIGFVSAGVAVFVPNTAGRENSPGGVLFGLNKKGCGTASLNDVVSGLKHVQKAKGYGTNGKVGIGGFSFGGFVTAYVATQSDVFSSAHINDGIGCPFHPFEMLGTAQTVRHDFLGPLYGLGDPFTKEGLRRFTKEAPTPNVGDVRTPILMQYGENGAIQYAGAPFYRGLKRFGVPSELVIHPRTGHGVNEPDLRRLNARYEYEWFAFWVLGEDVPRLREKFGDPSVALRKLRDRKLRE